MNKGKQENIVTEQNENSASFLVEGNKLDNGQNISNSFEMSEIKENKDQSAIIDHIKDMSFLISGRKSSEETGEVNKDTIGAKPAKICGQQKELMERILNRKRHINETILNKNIKKKTETKELEKKPVEEQKNTSKKTPEEPPTQNPQPPSDPQLTPEEEQKKIIEEMISQGNTIFSVRKLPNPFLSIVKNSLYR